MFLIYPYPIILISNILLFLFYNIANTVFLSRNNDETKAEIERVEVASVHPVSREEGGSTSPSTWCPSTDDPGES
jgi:hypothetical protein